MTPNQMAATLDKVTAYARESIQHTADLRRDPSYDDRAWALDLGACTDSRCSKSRCSCQRRTR